MSIGIFRGQHDKNPIVELVSNHAEMCIGEMHIQEKHSAALNFIGDALKVAIDRVFEKITAQDYVEVFAVMTLFDHVLHQREFEMPTDSMFYNAKNNLIFKCPALSEDLGEETHSLIVQSVNIIFHTCCFLCRDDSEQYIDYIVGLLNLTTLGSLKK